MSQPFNRIGLFIRKEDPVLENAVVYIHEYLQKKGLDVVINETLGFLPKIDVIDVKTFPKHCDLVMAIGGDGTLLSASRVLAGGDLALVGINVGRLGFLADVTLEHLDIQLSQILAGQYRSDTRFLLEARIKNEDQLIGCAMNDVVVHGHQGLRMIEFETAINSRFLNSQRADGILIATPTGSTAYAMSAGGPILDVDLDALVLASICPHALSNRPLVIAADSDVDIRLSEKSSGACMVSCDGRPGSMVNAGDVVNVRRSSKTITLLHLVDHDHYSILRAKLEWGRQLT